jgi:phage tail-like protein
MPEYLAPGVYIEELPSGPKAIKGVSTSEGKYVSVRRYFAYLEASLKKGLEWAVFGPNDELTWAKLRGAASDFLLSEWRNGALIGATLDEAFFVRCDRTTMTQADIDDGRLIVLIGVAPVKPAEFVNFRIALTTVRTSGALPERSPTMAVLRNDPYLAQNFAVEIDGVAVAHFAEVSGLEVEFSVVEYRNGSEDITVRKLPGLAKYPNITLTRGIVGDLSLWHWIRTVREGQTQRRNGAIALLNEKREPVLRFRFSRGWPCKWVGPALNAKGNDVAIEELVLCHEGLEVE